LKEGQNANGQYSHEYSTLNSVASKLQQQACTVGNRCFNDGFTRMRFNSEVGHYAQSLVNDVEQGHKSPDEALHAMAQEQRSLLDQAYAFEQGCDEASTETLQYSAQSRSHHPPAGPDPQRVVHFAHAEKLEMEYRRNPPPPPAPAEKPYAFFPQEYWPTAVPIQEPGFYVVPKNTTREQLEATLFATRNPVVLAKYHALNPLPNNVKAGTMIVLSDPLNPNCTSEEAWLMQAAGNTNAALETLTPDEAEFMVEHRETLETFMGYTSKAIGVGEAIVGSQLTNVKASLIEISLLHQRTIQQHGHLDSPEFFTERQKLLAKLDSNMSVLVRKSAGLPDYPNLKTVLGIHHPNQVHRWKKAGAISQPPGYATHIDRVSKAAKYVKAGGWIGIAVGGGESYLKVQEVCEAGNTEACKKARYTEGGGFAIGTGLGMAASGLMTAGAGALCVAVGVPTAGVGTLVCGVITVGVIGGGTLAVGVLGSKIGEVTGEIVYEVTK
jgi:hypothetical protein